MSLLKEQSRHYIRHEFRDHPRVFFSTTRRGRQARGSCARSVLKCGDKSQTVSPSITSSSLPRRRPFWLRADVSICGPHVALMNAPPSTWGTCETKVSRVGGGAKSFLAREVTNEVGVLHYCQEILPVPLVPSLFFSFLQSASCVPRRNP